LRTVCVASEAVSIRAAAEVLFETGGKRILSEVSRQGLRRGVENACEEVLTALRSELLTGEVLQAIEKIGAEAAGPGARDVLAFTARQGLSSGAREAARAAAKQVARGIGRAAG